MNPFSHLRVHSYYTLLGATASPEQLAQRAADEGMTSLALTDTNVLYGAVAFDRACRAAGIRPIIGLTVTVTWPDAIEPASPDAGTAGQLVLLARNSTGYRSLCRLTSLIQGSADREAQSRQGLAVEQLRANAGGLICLTGGRRGFSYRCLAANDAAHDRAAHRFLGRLCGIYGPDHTFVSLELQTPEDLAVAHQLSEKAAFLGLNTVVVHPTFTLMPDDARLQLLAAIDHNCLLGEVPPEALPYGGDGRVAVHWLSTESLSERYAAFPEALARTRDVAALCTDRVLPDGTLQWPTVALAGGHSPADLLRQQALSGAERRYGAPLPAAVTAQLTHELAAINTHGYAPLFLAVADIVRYARQEEIPVSTRGSVANSLVAYVLQITTVDPIEHGLLFERFLSPGRADPPDIDLDFCSRRRDEVQAYIRRTYGEDRVALVGAMSTLRLRSAGRETAKAYGLSAAEIKRLLARLPRHFHPRQEIKPEDEILADIDDPQLRTVARAAYSIAGFPHHLSIHAGGLIITPGPLTDLVPVQMAPKGYLTTQYDHRDCEAVGLPKLDLLGIRALTVLHDAAVAARDIDPDLRVGEIPLDDPATADLLAGGDTIGVFQCDSVGARRTLRKLRARTVRDLAVANAFFKPGPATGGQADIFVRRYRGEAPTRYQHPSLEPILAPTKGVLIFQEQVLRVATEVAGLSWAQADHIRRGMSKMKPGEMRELAGSFITGCRRPDGLGLTQRQAKSLWEQVSAFSGYGFNQGHATAYADVSYRSAYMKRHYPAAFFWARLRNYGGYHHPAIYMVEAIRLGIDVRPPHVNHSLAQVTLDRGTVPSLSGPTLRSRRSLVVPDSPAQPVTRGDNAPARSNLSRTQPGPRELAEYTGQEPVPTLWLGLGLIRDLRRQAVAAIVRARRDGPFTSLRDLLLRVDLQPKEITHLIQSGALDRLGANRPAMLQEARMLGQAGDARQLAFDFTSGYAPPATASQRLAWETRLLGYPLSALREALAVLGELYPEATPLESLPHSRGPVTAIGVRLPGWHRGGFGLWDGSDWCWAESNEDLKWPPVWEPTIFSGHWRQDRWGMGWMMVGEYSVGTF